MEFEIVVALIVIIVIPLALLIIGIMGKKRREAFVLLAEELALSHHEQDPGNIVEEYQQHDFLHWGHDPSTGNILKGSYRGQDILFFDLFFTLRTRGSSGSTSSTEFRSAILVKLPEDYPELLITPARLAEWTERWVQRSPEVQDFDPGDPEFTKGFAVKTKSESVAREFLQPGMKSLLLGQKFLAVEIKKDSLALVFHRMVKPGDLRERLDLALAIQNFLPRNLPEDQESP